MKGREVHMQRLIVGAVSLVSITLFLGLAVWAEGGWTAFAAHPALLASVLVSYAAGLVAPFTSGGLRQGLREDRANRWVLPVFGLVGLAAGFIPPWTDQLDMGTFGGETVRWVGLGLYAAGCILRIAPVFELGDRFSGLVAIQPGHRLETGGLYSVIRNPSYLGLIVLMVGWSLVFRSWLGVALTALVLPPLAARMTSEERLLESEFGADYVAYRARTWRLIPWVY
jgi:protein-S-isoprenylcysteine O-methyltransferase Ste14